MSCQTPQAEMRTWALSEEKGNELMTELRSNPKHSQGKTAPGGPPKHIAHKQASQKAAFAIVKLSTSN